MNESKIIDKKTSVTKLLDHLVNLGVYLERTENQLNDLKRLDWYVPNLDKAIEGRKTGIAAVKGEIEHTKDDILKEISV